MGSKSRTSTGRRDLQQEVTNTILAALQAGTVPWHQPWTDVGVPRSLATGNTYRGINTFLLGMQAAAAGYASRYWGTFKQITGRGGSVQGQKGTQVVFWKMLRVRADEEEQDNEGETSYKTVPMLRHYTVFNLDQVSGDLQQQPADAYAGPVDHPREQRHEQAAALVAGYPHRPRIREVGDEAYYVPSIDAVTVPPRDHHDSLDAFYATVFHELGHSTGHETRLNRFQHGAFDSHAYGREELTAEMTAAFLTAECGIDATRDNSAAYLNSWMRTIREDTRAVIVAAGAAHKAADHILARREDGAEDQPANSTAEQAA